MSKVNDGGPALVGLEVSGGFVRLTSQLTIRDYFAAIALQGATADLHRFEQNPKKTSELCYAIADAMLAERDK